MTRPAARPAPAWRVVLLADQPGAARPASGWLARHWYLRLGRSRAELESALHARARRDSIPLGLVALAGARDRPVGVVGIGPDALPGPLAALRRNGPERTHCLIGLYVLPSWRGRGVGAALCRAALAEAQRLKLPSLDLYAADRPAYFARLGWTRPFLTPVHAGGRPRLLTFLEHPLPTAPRETSHSDAIPSKTGGVDRAENCPRP